MNVSYEARSGYLYVKATGEFSLSSAQDSLIEWVKKAHIHALNRILCDLTLITGFDDDQASTMTLFKLGEFAAESIPGKFRLAVLETPQQFGGGRFCENVMVNRGAAVKVTINLNEALEWLDVTRLPESEEVDIK